MIRKSACVTGQMRVLLITFLAAAGSVVPSAAQTPPQTPYPAPFPLESTCPIKHGIKSFTLDDTIQATSFQSAFIPTLSSATIAAFTDPTLKVITHFEFSTSDNILRAWSIPVPIGSSPVPAADTDFEALAVAKAVVQIDKVYTVCTPRPTIMIVGPVLDATQVFGSVNGLPHTLSFAFDPSNTSNLYNAENVQVVDAGANAIIGYVASVKVVPEHKHKGHDDGWE